MANGCFGEVQITRSFVGRRGDMLVEQFVVCLGEKRGK